MADILGSFKKFISYLIKANIKKIKKNNFNSLLEKMDLYIEEKFEIQMKEKKINIINKMLNFISKNEKKINKNYKDYVLNDTLSYIKDFEEVLIEYKLIDNNNNILKKMIKIR